MYFVVLVLDNPDQTGLVLEAWEAAGALGATVLYSTGLGRVRKGEIRDDLPLMPSLADLLRGRETHNRTIFSVVESEAQAQALLRATESVVGDLSMENTGLMFIARLDNVYGLKKQPAEPE